MRRRAARLAALACCLLFIALASTAAGATASVTIAGFAFDPASVTINAGDSVTWTNRDQVAHSVVFAGGGPRTGVLATGASATLTFATAGTFNYVCGIHGAAMMGTVIVRAVATPVPTVAPTVARTVAPTLQPTAAPTVEPTIPPTPTASPTPTATAVATSAAPTIAAAVPTEKAAAPAASSDGGGPSPLIIAGAAIAAIALIAGVLTRVRR
jgi:plastocyanin